MKNLEYFLDFYEFTKINTKYFKERIPNDFEIASIYKNNLKKEYLLNEKIFLNKNIEVYTNNFHEILQKRCSTREFKNGTITFNEFSSFINLACGINNRKYGEEQVNFRVFPSAGGLFCNEIYFVVFNIEGLENGVYHYNLNLNFLEFIKKGSFKKELKEIILEQELIEKSSFAVIITSYYKSLKRKYNARAYRYTLMDSGHIMQNMYLSSVAINIGFCSIGGFLDNKLENFLNLNLEYEIPLYIGIAGKIN